MRNILFTPIAFEQYNSWQIEDKQVFKKLQKLILETSKNPFDGIGKPEPLKYEFSGFWSRRITQEHRLVYKATDTDIQIIACKFHYI